MKTMSDAFVTPAEHVLGVPLYNGASSRIAASAVSVGEDARYDAFSELI
ncbi:Uncharacterised protein [BD1-7 clade bacterium]|uniref:Uncharacterized protein n=1 Tax=BD1-7 clade bacterium TaxID=2029982 RepID=A0A5S9NXM2_9GAMM|nr:Uncharacterised protein [BD1-7 clade bacterium]CAA0095570.1 Uncharacterised protein [BD1-7 clade bacterium]